MTKKKPEGGNKPRDLPYDLGTWKGRTQYKCRQCPYDTLHEADMLDHIAKRHTPPAPQKVQVKTGLHDRFGNPLTKEVEIDG